MSAVGICHAGSLTDPDKAIAIKNKCLGQHMGNSRAEERDGAGKIKAVSHGTCQARPAIAEVIEEKEGLREVRRLGECGLVEICCAGTPLLLVALP